MKQKFFSCIVCLLLLAACPRGVRADTLKLVSASGNVSGGNEIYPYNFSVNSSKSLVTLMCLNMNRTVTVGESWAVNKLTVPLDSSTLSLAYRMDAYLYSLLGQYSTSDVQYAVWSVMDWNDATSNSAWDSTALSLVKLAYSKAQDSSLIASGFFSNFVLYTPDTSNTSGWTAGQPQSFIGTAATTTSTGSTGVVSAATPEPSSVLLLLTGCMGVAILAMARHRSAATLPELSL